MEFTLGAQAEAMRAEVRQFLEVHLTPEILDRVRTTGTVHDWGFYRALAQRGWIAAGWPVEYGGQGRDPWELTAMREEMSRADAPLDGLATTLMVASTLRHVGSEEQKQKIIPQVLAGELIIALGYSEPDCGSDVAAARTAAVRDGEEWVVNGSKMFTTLAHEAAYVFLLARTRNDGPKHKGLTMFLVPLDTPGIGTEPVHTLGGERTNVTYYSDVRIPDSCRVGEVNEGWRVMTVALTYERSGGGMGEQLGALHRNVVAWAVAHPEVREDPGVHERLGRIAMEAQVSRLLGYRSVWLDAAGILPGVEGSMTKLFSSEAFVRASGDALAMVGPVGVLGHGEPGAPGGGVLEHTYRHATVTTIYGGTSEIQRGIIAERGLGLPRSRKA